jgi:hypothetical protein
MQHRCWLLCKVLTMSSFAPSIPSSEGISSAIVSARRSRELLGGQEGDGVRAAITRTTNRRWDKHAAPS